MTSRGIERLAGLARLRSDLEMRRLAAYQAHVEAARAQIAAIGDELEALYRSEAAFSLSGARVTNALAGDRSRALGRAEQELDRMLPGFEAARAVAIREFGRVQVLDRLAAQEVATDKQDRARREVGYCP